jgi:hypothetical protein
MTRVMGRLAKIVDNIGAIVAGLALLFLVATIAQPLRVNWGDPWSDCNAQNAGHFFAEYGWAKTALTPVLDIEPLTPESLRYTHYPPLPDIINGLQREFYGNADISVFRILAVGLSALSLLLFFRWVKSLWGASAASFSLALFAGSLLWLQYADTVHHVPIYSATGFGALLCGSRWLTEHKARHLVGVSALTFLCFLASYDFVFFVPLMTVATAVMLEKRLWSRHNRLLFAALVLGAVAAVVVKNLLVIWAVGWHQFYGDLLFQFQERATSKHALTYREGLSRIAFFRLWRFFTPLFFVVAAAHLVLLAMRIFPRSRAKLSAQWTSSPLLLLVAGLPFLFVFSQLFCEQYHPTLLLLPYYAIGGGTLLAQCWESAKRRGVAVTALVLALGWQVKEVAAFPKEFLARSDVKAIRAVLDEKDHHRFVLTNGAIGAPFLYYWNRYALNVSQFAPEHIPRYVISLQDQFGNEPVRLVHFANLEKVDFDKYVYGAFAGEKKWDWIANPGPHRFEWQPIVRAKDDALVAYVSQFGDLELDTGTAHVWKLERQRVMDFLAKQVMLTPTTSIDFGTVAAEKFKVSGFRYPEQPLGPDKPGSVWTERRYPSRMVFTLQGLRHIPTGAPPRDDSALRLDMPPGRPYRIEIGMSSAMAAQNVSVSLNGSVKLAELSLEKASEYHVFDIDVPAEALDPSGLQVLRLDIGQANAEGLGVALAHFQIVPR